MNGWCSRMSPLLIWVKISSSVIIAGTKAGVYGLFLYSSKPSIPYIFIRKVRSKGPFIWKISSSLISNSIFRMFRSLSSILSSTSRRITSPHWRFFNCFWISFKRSAASSSSMVRSAFRMIRYGQVQATSLLKNSLPIFRSITCSSRITTVLPFLSSGSITILGSTDGTWTVANSSSSLPFLSFFEIRAPIFNVLFLISGKGLAESIAMGVRTGYTLSSK